MASTAADGVGEPVEAKGKEKERGGGLLGRGSSAAARTTTSACSACARRRPSCTRGCAAGPSSPVATSSSPPSSLRNIIYRVLDQIWGFLPSSTASSCRSSCHPCRIRSAYIFCYRERLQGFWLDHMSRNERPMHRQDLQVVESIYGVMGKQELLEAQEQEQLAYQDKLVVRTKERKNALESYVYDTRNKLSERYRIFATDSEREEISVNLQQTEDWLYEDDDETEAVYTSKLEELKKPVDPIEYRCKDGEARAEATRELLKRIVDHRVAAKSLSASERDAIDNECTKVEMWLRESSQLQESLLGRTLRRRTPSSLQRHESRTKGDKLDTNSSTRVFAATYAFLVFMTHATRVFAIGNISFGAVNFFKAKKSFLLWA